MATYKKKSTYTKRSKEEIKAEVNQFGEQVITAAREYTHSPADVAEMLDFMAKFPNYSLHNQILVRSQYPGALAIASYKKFTDMGASLKGQKSLKIFAPVMAKAIQTETGEWVSYAEATKEQRGKAKSGELKQREKIVSWRMASVFDVTQTDMKPEDYPKIYPNRPINFQMDAKLNEVLINALDDFSKSRGVLISEVPGRVNGAALGVFRVSENGDQNILIDGTLPPSQKSAVRIHEIGHSLMHADPQSRELDTAFKELQAEMVSHIVAKHFGLDTTNSAAPYIASWTDHLATLDKEAFTKEFRIMDKANKTARQIIEAIDPEIQEFLIKERGVDVNGPIANADTKEETSKSGFSKAEVDKANQIDIVDFANAKGIELKQESKRTFRGVEHDSLVVDRAKNYFMWNSRQFGGNTIKFAETFVVDQSLDDKAKFKAAVLMLNDPELKDAQHIEIAAPTFTLDAQSLPSDAESMTKVNEYLVGERRISADVVQQLQDAGVLKTNDKGNAVFLWRDPETDKIVGATEQGTQINFDEFSKRGTLKHIEAGSKSGCGFQYTGLLAQPYENSNS